MSKRYRLTIALLAAAGVTFVSAEPRPVELVLDGLSVNADHVVAAENGEVGERLVIVLHGTLAHKDMDIVATLQDAFAEAGMDSLAISLSLGVDDRRGMYPCDAAHRHRAGDAVSELAAWTDWARQSGYREIVVLGHSRGANQVARFGLESPPDVSLLVLVAPPTEAPVIETGMPADGESTHHDGLVKVSRFLHCSDARVTRESYLSYHGPDAEMDTLRLADELGTRTLIVAGSEDDVVPNLLARLADIDNPVVSAEIVDGAGHFFRDLYAYEIVDLVVATMPSP